ncbi:hypothetical protein B0H14DRAFT_2598000 [Mycena olivaceomarginata]|nr:hypothetical protein B0H14DRAFT_2598000 [Mycena olivaceomarginata]
MTQFFSVISDGSRQRTSQPAFVKTLTGKKKGSIPWRDMTSSRHWQQNIHPGAGSRWSMGTWTLCRRKKAVTGQALGCGSSPYTQGKQSSGEIKELLVGDTLAIITLEQFVLGAQRHPQFLWPVLRRPTGKDITEDGVQSFLALDAASIQLSAHRNPESSSGTGGTDRDICLIKHDDDDHFILNMGGFHNFVRICRVLPTSLTDLKPLVEDRVTFTKLHHRKPKEQEKTREKERQPENEKLPKLRNGRLKWRRRKQRLQSGQRRRQSVRRQLKKARRQRRVETHSTTTPRTPLSQRQARRNQTTVIQTQMSRQTWRMTVIRNIWDLKRGEESGNEDV